MEKGKTNSKTLAKEIAASYAQEFPWYCYSVVSFNNGQHGIIITDAENIIGWLDQYTIDRGKI